MNDVPTDQPLPPPNAPDAALLEAIRHSPRIVAEAWGQANGAWEDARYKLDRGQVTHALWRFFGARAHQATGQVGKLRVALQAAAALRALADLSRAHLEAINDDPEGACGDTLHRPYRRTERRVRAEVRAAMASQPALARVQAEGDAALVARTAGWERAGLGQRQWPWDLSPAALLWDLRRRRVGLALDDAGRITAIPGTVLLDTEWVALRKHRAALAALLAAETDPPRPLVVA